MAMRLKNLSEVRETDFGVYYWVDSRNRPLIDSNGNNLCVQSHRNDRTKIEALKKSAKYWAKGTEDEEFIINGHAVFQEGVRKVNAEQYAEQLERLNAGLDPDPLSMGSVAEIAKKLGYKIG